MAKESEYDMKDAMPLISVIVPIYNTAEFLGKCIDSILSQTYTNLEIILVDDGSSDGSEKICDDYAAKDARIVVIHKENSGAAHTRNTGIAVAQGAYIMFVDSDDWVDTNICEVLMEAIVNYNAESSMCSYVREYPTGAFPKEICSKNTVFGGKEVLRILCGPVGEELRHPENIECFNSMCAKLYPSAVVKANTVEEAEVLDSWEDLVFNFRAFSFVESMAYVNQACYHYRKVVQNSITNRYKPDLEAKAELLYNILLKTMKINGLDGIYQSALSNRIALNTLGLGLNCVNDDAGFGEKCRRIRKVTTNVQRKESLQKLSTKNMPVNWKLFYFCAKHNLVAPLCGLLMSIKYLRGKG